MITKILCTADLHGNIDQFRKLFLYAQKINAEAIFIAGDLTPKSPEKRTPKKQADFINNELIPEIKEFKKHHISEIFIILGNDDFKANEVIMKKHDNKLWRYVNNTIKKFKDYSVFGYTNIPLTPFKFKDWEKVDSEEIHENTYRKPYILKGFKSMKTDLIPTKIDLDSRKNNIERDIIKGIKNKSNLILLIHAPPYNTKLDINKENQHLGSIGILNAIKKTQPVLTIHGHIHETVDMSGSFKDKIGKTICVNPGNFFNQEKLAVLEITLPSVKIKRKFI
ncbi:MAG: metallophosphoesterase [Candidatus Woesearchaeota archaeon]